MRLGLGQAFYLPQLAKPLGLPMTKAACDWNRCDPLASFRGLNPRNSALERPQMAWSRHLDTGVMLQRYITVRC